MTLGRGGLVAVLLFTGATWGVTIPLAKIAVSGGHRDIGIVFWQFTLGALALAALSLWRRRPLPMGREQIRFYLLIALIGTILPNWASLTAAMHLPAGILSIVIALVPMMAFPIAMALGSDRFSRVRLFGLGLGLGAIILIAAPQASLPDRAMVGWLPLALIAPLFYALEANVVAKWGTYGLDATQVLFGASLIGALLSLPIALTTGAWINPIRSWAAPEWAILALSLSHVTAYASYVWLVGRAGAVFSAQVGYVVTGCGIFWSKLILGESYSAWVWAALFVMMAGLALVQPRAGDAVARTS